MPGPSAIVAERSPIVAAALTAALAEGGIRVERTCGSAAEAVALAGALDPAVVLLGLGLDGLREAVSAVSAACEVVLFGEAPDDGALLGHVAAGAHGILLGATDPGRIAAAVGGVLAGEAAFPRALTRRLADAYAGRERARTALRRLCPALTARECDVLAGLAEPATAAEVARRLGVAPATVRRHCANAVGKLGVQDREAALALVPR